MRVVSTTLTADSEAIVAEAIASVVEWVDVCVVIDTGATDRTLAIAREIAGAKYVERTFRWCDDFAAARNFALDAARDEGATWALTLDTDERILGDGKAIRAHLARTKASVVLVKHEDGTYAKERLIRVPTQVRWRGPTHEALDGQRPGESEVLPGVAFRELRKDPEALRRKFARDAAVLEAFTRDHPDEPRWWYYLGASLQDLGEHARAIEAYRRCAALRGWAEEGAWACYRAAECCCALERFGDAIDLCAQGLAIHAPTAELAWLAGFAAYRARRIEDAIAWARMSAAMGCFAGAGKRVQRIAFRHLPALYEGPYDVLRWALADAGDVAGAKAAERDYRAAIAAREKARK